MTIPYVSGTVSVTAGSAVVTGVGTGWQTGLVTGGMFGLDSANGNPVPILSIDSDTQLTLAKPWRGTTAAGQAYWIMRDTAYGQQSVANANALATIINELRNPAVAALAAIDAQLGAGKVPRGLSGAVMEMFTVSDFAKTFLDETDAAGVRAVLLAQAALGFTPVQQGGGAGQAGHKLYIGWDPTAFKFRGQVDALDRGFFWMNADTSGGLGWVKLPNGLIFQNSTSIITTNASGIATINMPTAFASASNYIPVAWNGDGNFNITINRYGALSASSFQVRLIDMNTNAPHASAVARVDFTAWGY
jgi:hypothetical protein